MNNLFVWLRLPLTIVGLVLFFIAERYFATETFHLGLRVGALVLIAAGLGLTLALSASAGSRGQKGEAKSWRLAALWIVGLLVSLGLYVAYLKALGDRPSPETFAHKALLAVWLLGLCLSLFAGAGLEWGLRESGQGEFAEPIRVRKSGAGWISVGVLFAALVALNYAGEKKNVTRDWSYLKVRTPSESTVKMVKTLTQDMTIALFYPPGNEVRTMIADYFSAIAAAEPRIKVQYFDKDMHPTQAEAHRVSRNGQIVFDVGGKKARIDTSTTIAKARKTLKELDSEFQKNFLEITADKKTVYFTRGHGEASWVGDSADDALKSLRLLEGYLRQQNYSVRLFGVAEGSASAVPDDASAVVIVGPTEPFQQEEVDALKRYVEGGGNLMVFLDLERAGGELAPQGGGAQAQPLYGLIQSMGIRYNETPMANDKPNGHVASSRSKSDHWFIFSNIFTSHDSVVSLARHDERVAVVVYQGGYLSVTPELGNWKAFETVRTLSDTFNDINRNFDFDEKDQEKRDAWVIGAVAEFKGQTPAATDPKKKNKNGRVVVFTDATAVSDALVRNIGNALYFADSLKWMVGESELAGQIASEEDVKIRHTRREDVTWFYGTVVAVPLLVLGAGYLATRRRKGAPNAR